MVVVRTQIRPHKQSIARRLPRPKADRCKEGDGQASTAIVSEASLLAFVAFKKPKAIFKRGLMVVRSQIRLHEQIAIRGFTILREPLR